MEKESVEDVVNRHMTGFIKFEFNNHRSGRTSRMLAAAFEAAMAGRAVYILCTSESIGHTRLLAQHICEIKGFSHPDNIKYETIQTIGEKNIDWYSRKLINAHPNCQLFIDHFVYALKYSHILEGYHAYDAEVPVQFTDLMSKNPVEVESRSFNTDGSNWNEFS